MKGRRYFKSIKDDLAIQKERREGKINAKKAYKEGKIYEAVDIINSVRNLTPELIFLKCQFLYQLQDYKTCVSTALLATGYTTNCITIYCF
jgi:hypothetical protein